MSIQKVALKTVATLNPPAPSQIPTSESEVAFVPMAAVSEDGTMRVSEHKAASELSNGLTYFQSNDILVAKITPCFENNKIAEAVIDHAHGFGSTEFHVIRPDTSRLNGRYLLHFLRQDSVRGEGVRKMTGSAGQRRIPRHFLEGIKVPLPSIDEQRRISLILDQSDTLRQKTKASLSSLDALKKSIFTEYFGSMTDNKRWPIGKIVDIIESTQYGTSLPSDEAGSLPILRMGNITYSGEIDLADLKFIELPEKDIEKHTVRHGDILFNRTNSPDLVGKTAIYKGKEPLAYAGYLVRVRCDETKSHPEYISGFLNSAYGKATLRGMCKTIIGMANINAKELAAIKIPIPPLDLQRAFAARVAEIDKLKALHRAHLAKLDELFASLQHRAFRGEL